MRRAGPRRSRRARPGPPRRHRAHGDGGGAADGVGAVPRPLRERRLAELNVPDLPRRESARAGGPPGSGLRTFSAGFARLTFIAGLALDAGTFEKDVTGTDGTRATIRAPARDAPGPRRGAVFSGDPGVPADSPRRARHDLREDALLQPSGRARGRGRRACARRTRAPETAGSASSEDSTAPFFRSRTRFVSRAAPRRSSSPAPCARGRTSVLRCRNSRAGRQGEGDARAPSTTSRVSSGDGAPPGRPERRRHLPAPETVNAASDVLTHREAERFVRLEGHATITSGPWTMNADVTDASARPRRARSSTRRRGARSSSRTAPSTAAARERRRSGARSRKR